MNTPVRDHSAFDAEISGKSFDFTLLRRLLRWVVPHFKLAFISITLVMIASFFAVLAPIIISRVVIDEILIPTEGLSAPDFGMSALVHQVQAITGFHILTSACLIYLAIMAIWSFASYLHKLYLAHAVLLAVRDLRLQLFAHLERRPASFYDKVAVGRVMTRVTNDIEVLFQLLSGLGLLIGEFVPFFVALGLMFAISPKLTGILLLAIPVVGTATFIFRRATRRIYRMIRSTLSQLNQNLQENLMGILVVQLHGREDRNLATYANINRENRTWERRAIHVESFYGPFIEGLGSFALGVIIWFGGQSVLEGVITLGSVILFVQFIDMLFHPITAMGEQYNVLFRAMASCERIFQALDWDEAISEPADPAALPKRLKGKIEFRHLTFSYDTGTPVIQDVSFTIAPGERIAIVGATGSGKTTLIRLLNRFYPVAPGQIFLDDIDICQIHTQDLRHRIGVVLQDFHIFSGSIYDNIALGNPAISRERATAAAELVHADPFIRALPQKYDTPLAERGQNLSHGQRQLLAFARVLAANPEILILDEATASIDTETELLIQDALHELTEGRTSIIIAHRLQTIREAHRIVVLQHGRVHAIGTHEELIARDGVYKTLYELQFQDLESIPVAGGTEV